nr:hypothetical protein [Sphingomonas oligophenolica]
MYDRASRGAPRLYRRRRDADRDGRDRAEPRGDRRGVYRRRGRAGDRGQGISRWQPDRRVARARGAPTRRGRARVPQGVGTALCRQGKSVCGGAEAGRLSLPPPGVRRGGVRFPTSPATWSPPGAAGRPWPCAPR